jgi:hypothetical protein
VTERPCARPGGRGRGRVRRCLSPHWRARGIREGARRQIKPAPPRSDRNRPPRTWKAAGRAFAPSLAGSRAREAAVGYYAELELPVPEAGGCGPGFERKHQWQGTIVPCHY